jgi:predicted GNAT family acetyltransferase
MQIEHVVEHHRFLARLPEGDAVLAYRLTPGGLMDIRSTWVPAPARGHGVGGALVEAALAWARREGRSVIPSCWYVGVWLADHPEYRDVLAAGAA